MTQITFFKKQNKFFGMECFGHSGYAESGADIVCSAISALCGALHIGLKKVLRLEIDLSIDDIAGYFKLKLKNLQQVDNAQQIFKTIYFALFEIAQEYPKFVKIKTGG